MTSIDTDTILFAVASPSIAGEVASCSICLADIGQVPVRVIQPCQHSFHAACLDQWLVRRAECPLCRRELPSYAAVAKQNTFVEHVRELIHLLERDVAITRSGLTFVLVKELLQRYPCALGSGGLREASDRIQATVNTLEINGLRPYPLALESRYALQVQARRLRQTLAEQLGCQAANVHRHERLQFLRQQVRSAEVWRDAQPL